MLNPMCFDCVRLNKDCNGTTCQAWTGCIYKEKDESKKGMMYFEKNPLWNMNNKIKAKFSRLNHSTDNYIYVGLLVSPIGWTRSDYTDIMSYFDCIGFEKITEEQAKEFSALPTGNYQEFLKLERKPKRETV